MELVLLIVVALLFLAGAFVPRIDRIPWQGGFLLPQSKGPITITHRIWATWRLERVSNTTHALRQHFSSLKNARRFQARREL